MEETIENYPEQNSADANVMKKVISTAFNQYKAEKYGMVFWSHGEGWIPSPAKTRWFGQDGNNYMDIADLHAALQVAPDLDFLFFDACFMEAVEVAYALRDCRKLPDQFAYRDSGAGRSLSDSGSRDVFCRKCSFEDCFLLL